MKTKPAIRDPETLANISHELHPGDEFAAKNALTHLWQAHCFGQLPLVDADGGEIKKGRVYGDHGGRWGKYSMEIAPAAALCTRAALRTYLEQHGSAADLVSLAAERCGIPVNKAVQYARSLGADVGKLERDAGSGKAEAVALKSALAAAVDAKED